MVGWPFVSQILQIIQKIELNIDPTINPEFDPKTAQKLYNLYISENGNMPRIRQFFILEIHGWVAISYAND